MRAVPGFPVGALGGWERMAAEMVLWSEAAREICPERFIKTVARAILLQPRAGGGGLAEAGRGAGRAARQFGDKAVADVTGGPAAYHGECVLRPRSPIRRPRVAHGRAQADAAPVQGQGSREPRYAPFRRPRVFLQEVSQRLPDGRIVRLGVWHRV